MRGKKPQLQNVIPMKGGAGAPAIVPDAPTWMSDQAREVWSDLAGHLTAEGRLRPQFEHQLAVYCENVATFIEATTVILLEGSFYETGKGRNGNQKRKHPMLSVRQEAQDNMRRDSALFGLTPVDERRLGDGGQGDLFDDILKQLKNGTD